MTGLRIQLMSARRPRRLAALAGLAAMAFAQVVLALAACNMDAAPSHALVLAVDEQPPCHEEAPGSDALCTAHCQASEQTLDKSQAQVPVLPIYLLPAAAAWMPPHRTIWLPPEPLPAASPPARILFQSLLI